MNFFANHAISDLNSARKLKYLRFTFVICLSMVILFTFRYNVEYKIHFLNWILFPCISIMISSPFVFNKTKNFYLTSALTSIPPALCLLLLVWTAGGLDAPGCIWLAAIPLTMAVLLGATESAVCLIVIGIFIIAAYVCKKTGYEINYIKNQSDFDFERMFNFILFSIYSAGTSILYVHTETAFQRQLNSQKEEIDSLLKILIHDIGTPLTIMGITLSKAKIEKDSLARSIENMSALLNQVKAMQAVKDGKTVMNLSPTNLTKIIEDVSQELKPRFDQKEIDLRINIQHDPHFVIADTNILQYVILMNLLTNSIKFSHVKGIIEINTKIANNRIEIEVRDYGIGMPEILKKNIAHRYEATTRKGTSGERGTGYGLPLVVDFIKKLGGDLDLETSETDLDHFKKGTSFKVWLKKHEAS